MGRTDPGGWKERFAGCLAGEFAQGQTTTLVPPHLGVSPELKPSMSQIIFLAYLITSFLLSLLKRPNNNQEQKGGLRGKM